MSILEEVLSFAFGTYNADSTLRASAFEYGHVLYRSPANTLLTSERVVSPDANSVSLYDAEATLRALGFDEKFEGAYLGDHHVHPAGVSWMSQLPSPADVTSVSVANDLWPNELGELCYVAPKIQIVQSLLFGDVFVLMPTPGRARFASLAEQEAELAAVEKAYGEAHSAGTIATAHSLTLRRPRASTPWSAMFSRTSARRSEAAPTWYLCKTWPVWREGRDLWTRCPEDTAVARVGRGGSENSNCP